MDQAAARQLNNLRAAYILGSGRIRATVLRQLTATWANSPGYRDGDIDKLLIRLLPLVQAGQLQVAQLTSAFLAQQAVALHGGTPRAIPVDRTLVTTSRGVDPREVYRRPANSLYTALSQGASYQDAVKAGLNRLTQIAGLDLQLAKTQQARVSLTGSGASFYRRTLSGQENCRICVLAATQRYRSDSLMPIHGGCDCGIEELPVREDPGQIIDAELLKQTLALTGSKDPAEARREMIRIDEHGELGPVLSLAAHKFTGPAALDPTL